MLQQNYAASSLISTISPWITFLKCRCRSSIQREKDPSAGFAKDFVEVVRSLVPFWQQGSKVKLITNAGGLNPLGCAEACLSELNAAGLAHLNIGIVYGDDVLPLLKKHPNNTAFQHLDSGEPLSRVLPELVTANAYLGAKPMADLLKKGAHILITGRIADPSLTVAACIAHFDWNFNDYARLAQATVAGHLIECGTQVTGGICNHWLSLEDKAGIGFPFVEVENDGSFVITKPDGTEEKSISKL